MGTQGTPSPLERMLSMTPAEATLRTPFFTVEPPRTARADGYEWDHELRVALPVSYADGTRTYPVLWVTDAMLETALSVLGFFIGGVDLILVSVGPAAVPMREFSRRRTYDFVPRADYYPPGPGGEYLRHELTALFPDIVDWPGGGAKRFLDFLVDVARPALAADYRMDADDHGLFGYSAGGAFVGYALFARPGAFAKYICGSPALYLGSGAIFELEEQYAAEHDDLPAEVFFGAGEGEITEPVISGYGCVSSMAKMAETLSFRGYPSLRLTVKIFAGEIHQTAMHSVLGWGVRSLWPKAIGPAA